MQKTSNSFFVITLGIGLFSFYGLSFGEQFCSEGHRIVRDAKPAKQTDPSLIFNANMLTSGSVSSPNIIFSNGVNSPSISAWSMAPSTMVQRPVNVQFSVPTDLKTSKPISLELHFLIRKQDFMQGNARIKVNALYVHNDGGFPALHMMNFNHTNNSDSFMIVEPNQSDEFVHVFIDVPLAKSDLDNSDFAILSLTRIAPQGMQYMGDIYLVAVAFRYGEK